MDLPKGYVVLASRGGPDPPVFSALTDPASSKIKLIASTGYIHWMQSLGETVIIWGDDGVMRLAAPSEDARTTGPIAAKYSTTVVAQPAVADGLIYVPTKANEVVVLDAATLSHPLWSVPIIDSQPNGGVFCDGQSLAFANDISLIVYDVPTRCQILKMRMDFNPAGAPLIVRDLIYFVHNSKNQILVYDLATGSKAHAFDMPGEPFSPLLPFRDTVLCPCVDAIVIIDSSSLSTGTTETYSTPGFPSFLRHENGVAFYATPTVVGAARLEDDIKAFYVESDLIRDFDFSSGVDTPNEVPNFQVAISLLKDDGTPRPNQALRLTATEATTIVWRGESHAISPTAPVVVETDANGACRIAVPAGSPDSTGTFHAGLTAPDLMVTADFMEPGVRVVIRPHAKMQQNLQTIDQAQLTETAKNYQSQLVVSESYRNDPAAMKAVTQAINQTAGMAQTSMSAARKRPGGDLYCSPACDAAAACCLPADQPETHCICDQPYSFDIGLDSPAFAILTPEAAAMAATERQARDATWDGNIWDDIKRGVAKVVGGVIHAVEAGVSATLTAIKEGVTLTATLIVKTAQEAALLVQGIFNAIADSIEHVIEAVSFLFDWGKIRDLHEQIQSAIETAWTSIASGADGISYTSMRSLCASYLSEAKVDVNVSFSALERELGARQRQADAGHRCRPGSLDAREIQRPRAPGKRPIGVRRPTGQHVGNRDLAKFHAWGGGHAGL